MNDESRKYSYKDISEKYGIKTGTLANRAMARKLPLNYVATKEGRERVFTLEEVQKIIELKRTGRPSKISKDTPCPCSTNAVEKKNDYWKLSIFNGKYWRVIMCCLSLAEATVFKRGIESVGYIVRISQHTRS